MGPIRRTAFLCTSIALLLAAVWPLAGGARDLAELREAGVLRHLGVPYANFVTGSGDGLDVELMQGFAESLGLRYEYVASDWKTIIPWLTGRQIKVDKGQVEVVGSAPIRGDVIANGYTILPWRQQIVDFSDPTFPSGVWLIARADSALTPIEAAENQSLDIQQVKSKLTDVPVLTMEQTCLDPSLYDLHATGARIRYYTASTNLNEMVPAVIRGDAETTLLDVPDALIALEKWPGAIKVIGPISEPQLMGAAFAKEAVELRAAFNRYLSQLKSNGEYRLLVRKYYPTVFVYFEEFFSNLD